MSLVCTFFEGILRFFEVLVVLVGWLVFVWDFLSYLRGYLSCLTQQTLSEEKVFQSSKNQLDIGLSEHRTGIRGKILYLKLLSYQLSAESLHVKTC